MARYDKPREVLICVRDGACGLEVGSLHNATRDENGWYFVPDEDCDYCVMPDEAEEVEDGAY